MDSSRNERLDIRDERPGDVAAIRDVNRLAFRQDQEANIVDALRSNGASLLSLVAAAGDRVVGHIMYSAVSVEGVVGAGLAPMAVHPEYQRQGIGSALVDAGTARLRERGCPFIVVLGHADFYPRFGFRPASSFGIRCEWDVPDEVFMVLVLDAATMRGVRGLATYRPEFSTVA
jgi:putative acetyltransferase